MEKRHYLLSRRPLSLVALILSIPAFYLILTGPTVFYRNVGHGIYAVVVMLLGMHIFTQRKIAAPVAFVGTRANINWDAAILLGAAASIWPSDLPWSTTEWALRMGYCGIVFIRMSILLGTYVVPNRLLPICTLAVVLLAVAGAGFFWLEPRVHTYGDGVWLAFTTGATVGYGDLVPSTPASRIFAAFIVLLGYALFSVVTASIAALFVGEDEKLLRRAMHADLQMLRKEIAALRAELRESFSASFAGDGDGLNKD